MRDLFENKVVRYTLLACGLLIALMLACIGYFKIVEVNNTKYAYEIAQRLGYTESRLVFANNYCWDIGSKCGKFIHFTTSKSLDELKADVERLGFTTRLFGSSSGFVLFEDISLHSDKKLTANGIDASGLDRLKMKAPAGWEWYLTDQDGEKFTIRFYETSKEEAVYRMGDERIQGNIVTVMLRTR